MSQTPSAGLEEDMVSLVRDLRHARHSRQSVHNSRPSAAATRLSSSKSSLRTPAASRDAAKSPPTARTSAPSEFRTGGQHSEALRAVSASRWLVSSGVAPSVSTIMPQLGAPGRSDSPAPHSIPMGGTGQRLRAHRLPQGAAEEFPATPAPSNGSGGASAATGHSTVGGSARAARAWPEPQTTRSPTTPFSPTAPVSELETSLHRRRVALRRWRAACLQRQSRRTQLRASRVVGRRAGVKRALRAWHRSRVSKAQLALQEMHQVLEFTTSALLGGGRGRHPHDPARRGVDLLTRWANKKLSDAWGVWHEQWKVQRLKTLPTLSQTVKGWRSRKLLLAYNTWAAILVSVGAARNVARMWRHRLVASAYRAWEELARVRRVAEKLHESMRMLPGAEFLRRWRHRRGVTARYEEAMKLAAKWMRRQEVPTPPNPSPPNPPR